MFSLYLGYKLTMGSLNLILFRSGCFRPSDSVGGRSDYLAPEMQTVGIVPGCPVLGSNEQIVDGGEHDW